MQIAACHLGKTAQTNTDDPSLAILPFVLIQGPPGIALLYHFRPHITPKSGFVLTHVTVKSALYCSPLSALLTSDLVWSRSMKSGSTMFPAGWKMQRSVQQTMCSIMQLTAEARRCMRTCRDRQDSHSARYPQCVAHRALQPLLGLLSQGTSQVTPPAAHQIMHYTSVW